MLLYKENGSEVYLFSSFIKAMYEKNRFDTCKTVWHLFEWGTLCIVSNCGQGHLDVRTDDFSFLFSFSILSAEYVEKNNVCNQKTSFFCKRNVCELIYQYYRTESMCVYLEKIGNPFWSLEPVCSPSFHTLACFHDTQRSMVVLHVKVNLCSWGGHFTDVHTFYEFNLFLFFLFVFFVCFCFFFTLVLNAGLKQRLL